MEKLDFPVVTSFRDTQNYVNAETQGLGIHEIYPPSRARRDMENMEKLFNYIEQGTAKRAIQ